MREITASGQTVEEAVQSALEQLNTTRDRVTVNIIDEGSKGFLGLFGSKLAVVSVVMLKDPIEEAEAFIKEVTKNMGIDVKVVTTVDGKQVTFELSGHSFDRLSGAQ